METNMRRVIQTNEIVRNLAEEFSIAKGCTIKFNRAVVVRAESRTFMVEPHLEGEKNIYTTRIIALCIHNAFFPCHEWM